MANTKATMSAKLMIIIVIGVAFAGGYLVARERYKPQINELSAMVIDRDDKITELNNLRNRLYMVDGELVQNKDGEITVIEDIFLLTDGSRVGNNGVVTRPTGEEEELMEGEMLFTDGTIISQMELDAMNEPKGN